MKGERGMTIHAIAFSGYSSPPIDSKARRPGFSTASPSYSPQNSSATPSSELSRQRQPTNSAVNESEKQIENNKTNHNADLGETHWNTSHQPIVTQSARRLYRKLYISTNPIPVPPFLPARIAV